MQAVSFSCPAVVTQQPNATLHDCRGVPGGPPGSCKTFRPMFWNLHNVTFATSHQLKQVTRPTQSQGAGTRLHLLLAGVAKYCDHAFSQEMAGLHFYESTHSGYYRHCQDLANIHQTLLPMGRQQQETFTLGLGSSGTQPQPLDVTHTPGILSQIHAEMISELQTINHHMDVLVVIAACPSIHRCTDQASYIPGRVISQVISWHPQAWPIISPKTG